MSNKQTTTTTTTSNNRNSQEVIDLENEPESIDLTILPPSPPQQHYSRNIENRNGTMNMNSNSLNSPMPNNRFLMSNFVMNVYNKNNRAHKRRRDDDDTDEEDEDFDDSDEEPETNNSYSFYPIFNRPQIPQQAINVEEDDLRNIQNPFRFNGAYPSPQDILATITSNINRFKKPHIDEKAQQNDIVTLMNEVERLKKEKSILVANQQKNDSNNNNNNNNNNSNNNNNNNTLSEIDTINEIAKKPECPICFEKMVVMSATTCGHVFCSSCINSALKRRKLCPVCNHKLNVKSVHPLFL
ncbi:hypothetical protein DLAC_03883 [Tieghemostelium lacteum]|uniref:RING-type domain-containing protein n=1 Tax=Tieghemostelium lacteum TaxID=361077 RepID=A0A152A114_TIELA|nr:hypothetical protein DLAC_03883 [Tieghemostelium lacteum]|eukprot:KYQ99915.1 hypothetical protein DLAC_03883 [Tieghemostelium lacteum]